MNYKNLLLSTFLLISGTIYSMEENKNNISYEKSMGNFANIPDEILVKIFDVIFNSTYLNSLSLEELPKILELKFLNKKFNNLIKNEYKNQIVDIQNAWGLDLIETIQDQRTDRAAMVILSNVANLRIKNQSNKSAFSEACFHTNIIILKLLINKNININEVITNGHTFLMLLARSNIDDTEQLIELVELLIQAKADLYVKNIEGKTAFNLAKEAKNYEIAKLLEDAMKKESQKAKEEENNQETCGI